MDENEIEEWKTSRIQLWGLYSENEMIRKRNKIIWFYLVTVDLEIDSRLKSV